MRKRLAEEGNPAPTYNFAVRHSMSNSISLGSEETQSRLNAGTPYVVRLKVEPSQTIVLNDMIRGEVSFNSDIVDDKVLLKSDGMPTYHLAHIVDDVLMEITHAIRGEEWLPSAPAHVMIYQYLGWEDRMPRYAHVLFDLDGTLIDSAPAILASYRDAFAACGREAVVPIDASIVGPPLVETLQMLAGTTDATK